MGWQDLQGDDFSWDTSLTNTVTSELTLASGSWYDFRIRAYNVHGWSAWSATLPFESADQPD